MARDPDPLDLFDDDVDEKALVRVASRFDEKDFDDLSNPSVMTAFYRRLFPAKQLFLWLNQDHVPTRLWTHREIAFTLANDAYLRYNSFQSYTDFHKEVIRLNPARFEIGAIYNHRPKDKRTQLKAALKPQLRELVFDIDMTDYDEIRTCCRDKRICTRCWKFIATAVKVLDKTLRDDFGFQHLLWVYSGRRGIHCWISDQAALALTDDQRRGIVGFLEVVKGGAHQHKKVDLPRPLHPTLKRTMETLITSPFNRVILEDQDCFRHETGWEALLRLLPSSDEKLVALNQKLDSRWRNQDLSSKEKWQMLVTMAKEVVESETHTKRRFQLSDKLNGAIEDIKLQYLYPRIDAEVSKHQNHLLKSPFVVHPGTGRVCVPVDPARVDEFDPEKVPTVGMLLRELERVHANGGVEDSSSSGSSNNRVKKEEPDAMDEDKENSQPRSSVTGNGSAAPVKEIGWEQTSLKPYVDMFDKHINAIVKDSMRAKKAVKAETFDF